jgi:L-ascorbate metabolism protein UlaG (beta-lactamase superfamily)
MIQVQRLNMDNSLFLEISGLKIIIDPWLEGTEIDFFKWFNTQWHRTAPLPYEDIPEFDTVLITQKYPDHFHIETLKKINPKHIVAPKSLKNKIKKALPHATLIVLDAMENQLEVNNVTITFLPTHRKIDPIYDAYIIDDGKQSIFLATHGFQTREKDLALIKNASPCQLLINPFNHYQLPTLLGGLVSPGLEGVKHLCAVLDPKKVIATHDEDKHAEGLISKFAKVTRPSSADELRKLPWLGDRYLEINHYQKIEIS